MQLSYNFRHLISLAPQNVYHKMCVFMSGCKPYSYYSSKFINFFIYIILYYALQYIEIFYQLQALQEWAVYKRSDKMIRNGLYKNKAQHV